MTKLINQIWRPSYNLLFTLLMPAVFLRLYLKGAKSPGYRKRWKERLALAAMPKLQDTIWVHAVSVGEVLAAIPIIKRLLTEHPNTSIIFTCMTVTGSERAIASLKDEIGHRVYHCYIPYDLPLIMNKFIKTIKPKLVVIMETEIWPNLYHICNRKNIPLIIANARLSPPSIKQYSKIKPFIKGVLKNVNMICAQSAHDAKAYEQIGANPQIIKLSGNLKFDLKLPENILQKGEAIKQSLGQNRKIWIAASTHEGEDELILKAHRNALKSHPDLLLILVPRHPERFNNVFELCQNQAFNTVRRSLNQIPNKDTQIYLGDTMGELLLLFAACDVAFVAGSFKPIGGHNLLEPAALGKPVLTGPQLFNFKEISELMFEGGGALLVENESILTDKLISLFNDENLQSNIGQKALKVFKENQGAMDNLFTVINQYL